MPKPTTNNLGGWAKEFQDKFFIKNGELEPDTYLDIKQFISDLRKHDMEELIKYLDEKGYRSPNLKGMINYYYNK